MFKLFREINKVLKESGSHNSAVIREDFDFEYVSIEFSMNGFNIIVTKEDNKEVYAVNLHNEEKSYSDYINDVEETDVISKILTVVK